MPLFDRYDHVGQYLILGRLKVESATTTAVATLYQYNNGSLIYSGTTILDGPSDANTVNWKLYPLGYVEIPPNSNRDNTMVDLNEFAKSGFSLEATSPNDSGELDIDCFYLMPAEHMF